jgi:hypothetical protein
MKRVSFLARFGLLENWRVKLASVLIAILFWFAVVSEHDFEYELDLPIVLTDIPHGKTPVDSLPGMARVRVEGKGKAMLALLFYRDARVSIDCSGVHRARRVAMTPQMVQPPRRGGNIVAKEILYPDSVWIRLSPLVRKQVPVIPAITLRTMAGYILASPMTINPDSIVVEGPDEGVRAIDRVFTEARVLTDVRSSLQSNLSLVAPQSPASVKLSTLAVEFTADVQKLIELTLEEIPVEVRNVPPYLRVTVVPSTITLTLEGGEKILLAMHREDVQVYIDYDRASRESSALGHAAYISVPNGVRYRDVTPERFTLSFERVANHAAPRH